MRRLLLQIAVAAATLLMLVASLMLLSYARWVRGIADGNRALACDDFAAAERAYTMAENRTKHTLFPDVIFRSHYRVLVFNQARLLNMGKRYDDLARLLNAIVWRIPSLAEDPEYHFWMGIVEYQKALAQTDKQVLRAGLQRASDDYRIALAAAPDDWDAKYNYELTVRLLGGMRNKKDETQEKLNRGGMRILQEDPDKAKEQQQKLAPKKKS
jgi:tetratricopeptide (TPR) repeat protein